MYQNQITQTGKVSAIKIVPDQAYPRGAVWSGTICWLSSANNLLLIGWISLDNHLEDTILEIQRLKKWKVNFPHQLLFWLTF